MPSSSSSSPWCPHLQPSASHLLQTNALNTDPRITPAPRPPPPQLSSLRAVVPVFFFHLPHRPCGQGPCLIHLGRSEQGLARESCPQAAELAVQMDKHGHSALPPQHLPLCWKLYHSAWRVWVWSQHSEDTESLGSHTTACLSTLPVSPGTSLLARPIQCSVHTTRVAFLDPFVPTQQKWFQGTTFLKT